MKAIRPAVGMRRRKCARPTNNDGISSLPPRNAIEPRRNHSPIQQDGEF
jgi:hypothetical protein